MVSRPLIINISDYNMFNVQFMLLVFRPGLHYSTIALFITIITFFLQIDLRLWLIFYFCYFSLVLHFVVYFITVLLVTTLIKLHMFSLLYFNDFTVLVFAIDWGISWDVLLQSLIRLTDYLTTDTIDFLSSFLCHSLCFVISIGSGLLPLFHM